MLIKNSLMVASLIGMALGGVAYVNAEPSIEKHSTLDAAIQSWKAEPKVSNLHRNLVIDGTPLSLNGSTAPVGLKLKTDTGIFQAFYDTTPGTLGRRGRMVVISTPGNKTCNGWHGNALNQNDTKAHNADYTYDIRGDKAQNWSVSLYDYATCSKRDITFSAASSHMAS